MWLNRSGEMMLTNRRLVAWVVVSIYMAGMAYYSLVPRVTGPVGSALAVLGDRALHLSGYFVLTLLAAWALHGTASSRALRAMVLALAYGAALELAQLGAPMRMASWGDVLSNSIGCVTGAVAYTALQRIRRSKACSR